MKKLLKSLNLQGREITETELENVVGGMRPITERGNWAGTYGGTNACICGCL